MIAVIREIKASNQLFFAISTAVADNDKPMMMMTGPMTTGGNKRSRNFFPFHLMSADIKKYTKATPAIPAIVPGMPHSFVASLIGAMNAKLLPRKMGTTPFVTR